MNTAAKPVKPYHNCRGMGLAVFLVAEAKKPNHEKVDRLVKKIRPTDEYWAATESRFGNQGGLPFWSRQSPAHVTSHPVRRNSVRSQAGTQSVPVLS
jgi:hypothetical protein